MDIVEPPYKRTPWGEPPDHAYCPSSLWRFKMYCQDYEVIHVGPLNLSFIWMFFYCVLYTECLFKRGSTID